MELKTVCEELDELAVNYFQILEELSEQRRRFEKFVKEGYLNLSKARYSMGNKAVSSLQYDSQSMSALAHVDTRAEGDCKYFEVTRTKPAKHSGRKRAEGSESDSNKLNPETVVRRRRPEAADGVEDLSADLEGLKTSDRGEGRGAPTDPLLWFGVLVPQTLRQGQKNFAEAVDVCSSLASLQSKLDKAYEQYRSKLREKYAITKQNKSSETDAESTVQVVAENSR